LVRYLQDQIVSRYCQRGRDVLLLRMAIPASTQKLENTMTRYVLIEMNDYAYPKGVSVWHTQKDAIIAARAMMKVRGQTEYNTTGQAGWEHDDRFMHLPTKGDTTPDAYIIIRAD